LSYGFECPEMESFMDQSSIKTLKLKVVFTGV